MTEKRFYATGKRKNAIARIYMKEGTGVLQVNKRNFDDYFTRESLKMLIQQPLEITGKSGQFDLYYQCRRRRCCRTGGRHQTRHLEGPGGI